MVGNVWGCCVTLEERYHALSTVPEFRDIAPETLAALAASMLDDVFAPGEAVVTAGELADRVIVLAAGMLEVVQDEQVIRILRPGALLGELAFFAGTDRTATVRAAQTCTLLSLPFENFRAFLLRHPESLLILTGRIARMLLAQEKAR
jgi:CRP-like cAMP-binding protein